MKATREWNINNDLTYEQIGEELGGVDKNAVYMRIQRALENAKISLERMGIKKEDFFGEDK